MPADPSTRDERLRLQVAKTLARLYYARDHGRPWWTAQQALALLDAAEYVLRHPPAGQRRSRITGPGSDFLAAVKDEAVPVVVAAARDAGTES